MQTKTLIQATANVIKITELNKGNVVKMVDKTYSSAEIKYGVVVDILNSGSETYIQFLLYKKEYSGLTGEYKLYKGDEDIALFPASVDEVRDELYHALEGMKNSINDKEKEILKAKDVLAKADSFVSGELSKQLTEASFQEISNEEYKQNEIDKQAQIKAIEVG